MPMAYRVLLARAAVRELGALSSPTRHRMTTAMTALARNPRPPGAKLLRGPDRIWRIRVGDYRILYLIDDEQVTVAVIRVGHRSDAYR